jgi:type IV pilus assembly protein PilM
MDGSRAVGLDIGTRSVTITEVVLKKGRCVVQSVEQVELPEGAVREGEIIDIDAVAATIKQGHASLGLRDKRVYLGVANQRVVVRPVTLPYLPDDELRQSLPFQVQEFIPIPVADVELDYHTLEEVTDEQGLRTLRVLLVAAQKDMVSAHVGAAIKAGLKPVGVDLNPFALLRALATESLGDTSEVLIDIGAGVTSVVVHQAGVPLFVRILALGGDDITSAVASAEDIGFAEAELRKRSLGATGTDATSLIISEHVDRFFDEVRSSLDYFRAQTGVGRIDRVVLAGGGSVLVGLREKLTNALGLDVEIARPFDFVDHSLDVDEETLVAWGPVLTTSIGLALGGLE